MLEWMHDYNVISLLQNNFNAKTIKDYYQLIEQHNKDNMNDMHMAICDDNGEYLGTVSLKNINYSGINNLSIELTKIRRIQNMCCICLL